jgi:lipopolysaccharide biosynthesis regulator YciM
MDFDVQWLLIGLPVAFVLGWLASRLDLRQLRRDRRDAPRAYFEGLNLLLNEQQDKAIDAFIEAVQHDPDTTELHFALGNLFRRRGEFERAVRVHQHLLSRGDLKAPQRDRAQHALAQDFAKAGLFDRAEAAWRALLDTAYDTEARLALLSLFERSRDWRHAADTAAELERRGGGSFATRIAHYHCERVLEADAAGQPAEAEAALAAARAAAPEAPRPLLIAGQRAAAAGRPAEALAAWVALRERSAALFALVADPCAQAALAAGQADAARATIESAYAQEPRLELLQALDRLDPTAGGPPGSERRLAHLAQQPSLGAAAAVLALDSSAWHADTRERLQAAVQRAALPLLRYRCAACGFEAHHYFWQCPGCQGWDTYPPRLLEQQ